MLTFQLPSSNFWRVRAGGGARHVTSKAQPYNFPTFQPSNFLARHAQEAALDLLVALSSGGPELKLQMAAEPSLLPRLMQLLLPTTQRERDAPQPNSRRAATVMVNMAAAPGTHAAFRPFECGIAHLAMHPPAEGGCAVAPLLAELLYELYSS